MGRISATEVPIEALITGEQTTGLSSILEDSVVTLPAATEPENTETATQPENTEPPTQPANPQTQTEPEIIETPTEETGEKESTPETEVPEETTTYVVEGTQETEPTVSGTETTEPPIIGNDDPTAETTWRCVVLALLAVLLAAIIVDFFRKRWKNRHSGKACEQGTVSAATSADVSVNAEIKVAALQAQGSRKNQQDAYGISDLNDSDLYAQRGMLAVVADGMGGLANGSVVSNLLVRVFQQGFQNGGVYVQPQDMLLDLAMRANAQVNQMLRGAERSGSTLVAATVRNGYLHFLTVGDSHLYLYRGGALLQLNREHVYQEELAVKAVNRHISAAKVHSDPQTHSLTSYFGIGSIPAIDRSVDGIKLIPGDRIVLCSDGVYGTLTQEQMEYALQKPLDEATKIMGDMIEGAAKQYQDNYTAVILEYLN